MNDERLRELYAGTLALVVEHGYEKLTMDQIAEATRSSKATLYRQWGSKSALVVEALTCMGDVEPDLPDTGSLRGDLLRMVDSKESQGHEHDGDLIAAIMHAVRRDAELAEAVRTQIVDPGRAGIRSVVDRAVARGEVAADCPALEFIDYAFTAPVVLHHLFEGTEPSTDFLRRYVEGVLLPALGIHRPT
jgi:AcrR family transcriptional regulator